MPSFDEIRHHPQSRPRVSIPIPSPPRLGRGRRHPIQPGPPPTCSPTPLKFAQERAPRCRGYPPTPNPTPAIRYRIRRQRRRLGHGLRRQALRRLPAPPPPPGLRRHRRRPRHRPAHHRPPRRPRLGRSRGRQRRHLLLHASHTAVRYVLLTVLPFIALAVGIYGVGFLVAPRAFTNLEWGKQMAVGYTCLAISGLCIVGIWRTLQNKL